MTALNSASQYLEYLLNIDRHVFEQMLDKLHPTEFQKQITERCIWI